VARPVRRLLTSHTHMSILTELFIAPDSAAPTYDHRSAGQFTGARLGGLTSLEFETLWAILEGTPWDVNKHSLSEVASTESSWTFRFPQGYLDRLSTLDAKAIPPAVAAWAITDELAGTRAADLEPVVRELVRLAQAAANQGQGLFVWTAL